MRFPTVEDFQNTGLFVFMHRIKGAFKPPFNPPFNPVQN
jgi:hypothetical protein